MSHFDQESFSGLRCFYSESCQAWIWTGEPADLENPSITVCTDDPNEEQCKKRRCGLIYDEQLASGRIRKASSNNLFSGVKDCYEQITGQQNGCYKQDISYVSSTQTWFGRSVLAWGECALICKASRSTDHGECTFWTWASTSCSNCVKGRCYLHYAGDEEPDIIGNHRGHISGSRNCQDIGFQTNPVKPLESKIRSGLFDKRQFPVGICQSNCPAQEMPGFR